MTNIRPTDEERVDVRPLIPVRAHPRKGTRGVRRHARTPRERSRYPTTRKLTHREEQLLEQWGGFYGEEV